MRRFEGRVVLITGAASGIGRATAERLAEEGAKVVCADVQAQALEDAAKRVRELGAEAHSVLCDVSEPEAVSSAVRDTVERFGALHSLCNSAGVLRFGPTAPGSSASATPTSFPSSSGSGSSR
jgi:NAD(P)-dependent dehydrogenase (short-subunit alcohol dehydrogenase family)